MNPSPPLNGSDQLMRTFDYELRRHGFAGNQCQIILELDGKVSPEQLRSRLYDLAKQFPILLCAPKKIIRPKWRLIGGHGLIGPQVKTHQNGPNVLQKIFNSRLRINRGELMRFDLIEKETSRMDVVFTWSHLLMDATSAEHFLTAVSDKNLVLPQTDPQPAGAPKKWPERLELMKKSVEQLDKFCEQQPRALKTRFPDAPHELGYRVEKFSVEETKQIRAQAVKFCGALGDAQYHAVIAALELHRLHQKLCAATKSYILPMPVGLRPKGKIEPVFSNQVDMLMLQFLPEHLESVAPAVAALKAQALKALKENSISYGRKLAELFSFLPLPIFMRVLKHGLKGEICSLFFGDTANVNPKLENFLGARVNDFTHIAAVTPSPGLGVIYYYFRGELRVSIVHAKTVLNETEAAEFSTALRNRLLHPIP